MNIFYYILAILCGVGTSIQSGVNSELRKSLHNPVLAAIISFSSGLLVLLIVYPFFPKSQLPAFATLKSISIWQYTGGLLGAFYVTSVIMSIQKIGSANMITLIVGSQLLMAMVLDHFGWLGFQTQPLNIWRILGAVFIVCGALLILRN
ncbi:EamA-like transporter family protein [Emticicia sp. CRIBPO]|jgi:transporter family-2 protein|uniref:DMT family transporter n=1 Tax=Emticicia sp. CRIBPO TaxID=2683258 RepID=UPI001412E2D2|nr:DMT family transporter [Emticicia sp. CRIBPO]NBA86587.1 EamA-like transporter family protein [Emticicia sp. CRIBPO]